LLGDVPAMFPLGARTEAASIRMGVAGFEWDAYDFNRRWLAARWSIAEG
jgi:hypothetical protein